MYYKHIRLANNLTANGDYPSVPVDLSGERSIAIYGNFDGCTLQIVLFTEDETGTLQELPISADLTYTAAEAPSRYNFPEGMPAKVRITAAGLATDVSVNLHSFE